MTDAHPTLKQQIQDAVKDAMRAKDKARLSALRMITAAIKQQEVDQRVEVTDTDVLALLDKLAKQRRESIEQYRQAGRDELADQEASERAVIESFLPAPLTEAEIDALIEAAIATTGASDIKAMGRVMGELKPQVQGRADLSAVSARVKQRLGTA